MKSLKKPLSAKWFILFSLVFFSCQKENEIDLNQQLEKENAAASLNAAAPPFNLEVILRGEGKSFGHVKFRQDNDPDKIVNLDVWVRDLEPNHKYLLQRAVDAANVVDGNCTSASWLTLGKGLVSQSIFTDGTGTGNEALWRSVAAVASGAAFDIHFRVIDSSSLEPVLTSDCYEYVVR